MRGNTSTCTCMYSHMSIDNECSEDKYVEGSVKYQVVTDMVIQVGRLISVLCFLYYLLKIHVWLVIYI